MPMMRKSHGCARQRVEDLRRFCTAQGQHDAVRGAMKPLGSYRPVGVFLRRLDDAVEEIAGIDRTR